MGFHESNHRRKRRRGDELHNGHIQTVAQGKGQRIIEGKAQFAQWGIISDQRTGFLPLKDTLFFDIGKIL